MELKEQPEPKGQEDHKVILELKEPLEHKGYRDP